MTRFGTPDLLEDREQDDEAEEATGVDAVDLAEIAGEVASAAV